MSDAQNDTSAHEPAARPGPKEPNPGWEQLPRWEQRFRAPRVSLPDWAQDAPERSLFVSNATGTYELYTWDRASGKQRQVTDRPNGTTDGVLTPDGGSVWWFSDTDGDGSCPYLRTPVQSSGHPPPCSSADSRPSGPSRGASLCDNANIAVTA